MYYLYYLFKGILLSFYCIEIILQNEHLFQTTNALHSRLSGTEKPYNYWYDRLEIWFLDASSIKTNKFLKYIYIFLKNHDFSNSQNSFELFCFIIQTR